jgi:predicted dehydrogenase
VIEIGIIGCGQISRSYTATLSRFRHLEVVSCADIIWSRAEDLSLRFPRIVPKDIEDLLSDPRIGIVINLTPPSVHAEITARSLRARKSVYSEKPLAHTSAEAEMLVNLADEFDVELACAPDTILGDFMAAARKTLASGRIGSPFASIGAMLSSGPERWHPNPASYYHETVGPLVDMGPYYLTALITFFGDIRAVSCSSSRRSRLPQLNHEESQIRAFEVEVDTHHNVLLSFEGDRTASLVTSFDCMGSKYKGLEIYCTGGTLWIEDPSSFTSRVEVLAKGSADWKPIEQPQAAIPQHRGLGVAQMAYALEQGSRYRSSRALAVEVVEVLEAARRSSTGGAKISLTRRRTEIEQLLSPEIERLLW